MLCCLPAYAVILHYFKFHPYAKVKISFKINCIFAGGLYLAADGLLLYTIFGSGLIHLQEESEAHPRSPEVTCDFKTQRIWIFLWLGLNFAAILSLIVGKLKIYKTY